MFLRRILSPLRRDRRQLGVACALLFAAGAIEAWNLPVPLPRGAIEMLGGALALAVFGPLLLANVLLAPGLRHLSAPFGLSLFAASLLGRVLPGSDFSLITIADGGLRTLAGLLLAAVLVHMLFYARWTSGIVRIRRNRSTAIAESTLEADALWHGLVPTPGRREALMDPDVLSVDWLDRNHTHVRVIRWSPPQPKREEHLKIEEIVAGDYVLFSYVRETGRPGEIDKGLRAIRLTDNGETRSVEVTEYQQDSLLRDLIHDWLDDTLGRALDRDVAYLECASGKAGAKAALKRDQLAVGGVLRPTRKGDTRLRRGGPAAPRADFSLPLAISAAKLAVAGD